jgi:hypothetical protein
MSKVKLIQINLTAAKEIVRLLECAEIKLCIGCSGESHEESCPAKEALQLRNYLTQRVNNPNKNYGI